MPLPNLPVEAWQQILHESISLPTFLDADCLPEVINPFYFSHNENECKYWEMERHRNTLQRVCKSWDTYLRPFEYRYVRIIDVYHKIVPQEALNKAIRIYHSFCPDYKCAFCFPLPQRAAPELIPLIEKLGELSVEIIDMDRRSLSLLPKVMTKTYKYMPRLQAILKTEIQHPEETKWVNMITSLPNLRHLIFDDVSWNQVWPPFRAENLTTLSYTHFSHTFTFPIHQFNLPSLQHLRLPYLPSDPWEGLLKMDEIFQILASVGHNLLSLQLGIHHAVKTVVSENIWELCPRLERLDCGIRFSEFHPPPPTHPLEMASVYMLYSAMLSDKGIPLFPPPLIGKCLSLKRLILNGRWTLLKEELGLKGVQNLNLGARELVLACKTHSVTLEDNEGVSFEDGGMTRFLPK